jgi:hypothetical protein
MTTQELIRQCRDAFAEELAAWDIDPPLYHVKKCHDDCVAWLAVRPERKPLSDEQINEFGVECGVVIEGCWSEDHIEFARAILAHGIKEAS